MAFKNENLDIVVGLGNPGQAYQKNRHNIGFFVIDRLIENTKAKWQRGKGRYLFAEAILNQTSVLVAKPLTFMNESGVAVLELIQEFKISQEKLLVVLDDVNLPLGKLKLRPRGSDGGHKGLASVIYQLGSQDFPRLRLGIGYPSARVEMRDYVLGNFREDEKGVVEQTVLKALEAIEIFASEGLQKASSLLGKEGICSN